MAIIVGISHLEGKGKVDAKGINLTAQFFKTEPSFNIGAMVVLILTALLYAIFW
jgi:SSS family solute:Na+ symporter